VSDQEFIACWRVMNSGGIVAVSMPTTAPYAVSGPLETRRGWAANIVLDSTFNKAPRQIRANYPRRRRPQCLSFPQLQNIETASSRARRASAIDGASNGTQ